MIIFKMLESLKFYVLFKALVAFLGFSPCFKEVFGTFSVTCNVFGEPLWLEFSI